MSYAEALTAMAGAHTQQLRDYGGLLAQAGIALEDVDRLDQWHHVLAGYAEQLRDHPNG